MYRRAATVAALRAEAATAAHAQAGIPVAVAVQQPSIEMSSMAATAVPAAPLSAQPLLSLTLGRNENGTLGLRLDSTNTVSAPAPPPFMVGDIIQTVEGVAMQGAPLREVIGAMERRECYTFEVIRTAQ